MTEIFNYGQVVQMRLQSDWVEIEVRHHDFEQASLREFVLKSEMDAHLCFYFRGLPMRDMAGNAFRRTLSFSAHHLSPTELDNLTEVWDYHETEGDFKISRAYTADLRNRRILIIEGHWVTDNLDMIKLFIDAKGDGQIVQEIYFFAEPNLYKKHLPEIHEAFLATLCKDL